MRDLLTERDMERDYLLRANTWSKLRVRGTGPRYIKLSGRVVYDRADVEAWLEAQKVDSTSQAA